MLNSCVFLSGAAGLMYEILWIKRAALAFGSSSRALATVLAVFFLGLGLGSAGFGRIGQAVRRPLVWCAALEILLALNGALGPLSFGWADALYGLVYRHVEWDSWALPGVRCGLVAALLLPPTLLMGGTLPLFCRQAVRDPRTIGRSIGKIYAINTLGAAVGCAATGFALIPGYGIAVATDVAVACSLVAGLGFLILGAGPQRAESSAGHRPALPDAVEITLEQQGTDAKPVSPAPRHRGERPLQAAPADFFPGTRAALTGEDVRAPRPRGESEARGRGWGEGLDDARFLGRGSAAPINSCDPDSTLLGVGLRRNSAPLPAQPTGMPFRRHARVGLLFFLIGAVALANELLWARFLGSFIRNSVYTYTITLTVVLAGIVLGSGCAAALCDRTGNSRPLLRGFALLQAAAAMLTLVLTHLPPVCWLYLKRWGILAFIVLMLPPAAATGACFPLANRILVGQPAEASRQVGRIAALNILGGVFGSLAMGLVVLPNFGLETGIRASTGLGLLAAFLALGGSGVRQPRSRAESIAWLLAVACLAVWLALPSLSQVRVPRDFIAHSAPLLDIAEGYDSTLAVLEADGHDKILLADQAWQGSARKTHQIMAAHIPMIHHPQAREILVVGLGVGQTASRFLDHGANRLDVVEIEPRIFDVVRKHFPSAWMDDRRVRLIAEDGRGYVRHTARRYDVLSVEVGQLYRPGVEAFYTREFYQEARARLRPDGIIAQFVPLIFLNVREFTGVLNTFLGVFPEAALWYNTGELLLLGYNGPSRTLTPPDFEQILAKGNIRADLGYAYWGGPGEWLSRFPIFLGGFLASGAQLRVLAGAGSGLTFTDDRPRLAAAASDFREEDFRAAALIPSLRAHLSPIAAAVAPGSTPPETLRAAADIRLHNLGDLAASAILEAIPGAALSTTPEYAVERAEEALAWNSRNLRALKLLEKSLARTGRVEEANAYRRRVLELERDYAAPP